MARTKDKEREIAQEYYIKKGYDAKTIAGKLGLNIKTVYRWIKQYGWDTLRTAELTKPQKRLENIREIIADLAQQRLDISNKIRQAEQQADQALAMQLRKELAQIDNAAVYWNKILTQVDKDSKISLADYLFVMEDIFESLRASDPQLFMQTLDFQQFHLQKIAAHYDKKN